MEAGYRKVKEIIQSEIFLGKYQPGDRLPSGVELCKLFNVSHMTLDRALRELVKAGLIARSRSQGTVVCRDVRSFKGEIFLFVSTLSSSGTFGDLAVGLENVLNHNGYRLAVGQTNGDGVKARNYAEMVSNTKDVKGVVYAPVGNRGSWSQDAEILGILGKQNIPTVIAGHLNLQAAACYSCVSSGHYEAARQVLRHLVKVCHRKDIVLVGRVPNQDQELIIKGFRDEMAALGFELPERSLVLLDPGASISAHIRRMMSGQSWPGALFCLNDMIAMEAIQALIDLKIKVPEDIAVTGFGDIPTSRHFTIPITTTKVKHQEEGELLAGLLIDKIEGMRKEKMEILVDCEMQIRKSCGHALLVS